MTGMAGYGVQQSGRMITAALLSQLLGIYKLWSTEMCMLVITKKHKLAIKTSLEESYMFYLQWVQDW